MFAQIVTFRLKPAASREGFIALTGQLADWLQSQPGFLAYELYEGVGEWSDRIVWEDEACARRGRDRFLATEVYQGLIGLVDPGYRSFFGEVVVGA